MQIPSTFGSSITLADLEGHPSFRFDGPGGDRFRRETALLLELVVEKQLLQSKIASKIIPVTQICVPSIMLDDGSTITAGAAARKLKGASHLLLSVCTIGNAIADETIALQKAGRQLGAVLLDSIAGFALIQLANRMATNADEAALAMGLQASGRTNPGDNGFELSEQPKILELTNADQIGVGLTLGNMMNPRFSMSAIFGLGTNVEKLHEDRACDECKARTRCPHATVSGAALSAKMVSP